MLENTFAETQLLKKGLDGFWLKNQILANNIANADTPGFKAKDVNIQELFNSSLVSARQKLNMNDVKRAMLKDYNIVEKTGLEVKSDGNNIDVEEEMTELAKNQIMYEALIQKISRNIERMKYAIDEGGNT